MESSQKSWWQTRWSHNFVGDGWGSFFGIHTAYPWIQGIGCCWSTYIYIIYIHYTYTILSAYQTQDVDFQFWTIFDVPRHLLVQPPRWKRKTSSIVFTQQQGIVVASRLRSFFWISSAMLGDFSGESSQPHLLFWELPFFWEDLCVCIFIYMYITRRSLKPLLNAGILKRGNTC